MIVQWEDWVNHSDLDWYCEPVFSRDERDAIEAFHEVWRGVAQDVPDPMPYTVEQLIGTPVWQRLMDAAGVAREVFVRRGRFDDVT